MQICAQGMTALVTRARNHVGCATDLLAALWKMGLCFRERDG
ncbi:hypothetical protein PC129_g11119 [Phytophthora cactorum]|uniref:Uncharacterized protein n=1 Tax=Phytophthora cactorum TaxID=29920 RepID=A0A8T1G246_9STRA|nr:hypothetical protein Pcac1_g1755 [Phytophthora cactorum]KAG3120024.1 hypothetical protein PI125_g1528 [Phytophthora idaei]KAG2820607.1 hypothetical protein PC112_g11710 [Phytophthora cactorum]KAG2822738.1 hypothetical protein PC111_g10514 [Phytophthora cactorum]KAG2855682.1 hypothetical protein PC113_g12236 [Phytophthora cactorum]